MRIIDYLGMLRLALRLLHIAHVVTVRVQPAVAEAVNRVAGVKITGLVQGVARGDGNASPPAHGDTSLAEGGAARSATKDQKN